MPVKTRLAERLLLGAMAVLSAGLVVLQYHWTSELARVELANSKDLLYSQAQSICQAFDQRLESSTRALVPTTDEISSVGFLAANLNRFANKPAADRPLFARFGVVVPVGDGLRVFLYNSQTRQLNPTDPPSSWQPLLTRLTAKRLGHLTPFANSSGLVSAIPVFQPTSDESQVESQWTVTELDADYLNSTWLPDLLKPFLHSDVASVKIIAHNNAAQTIFESHGTMAGKPLTFGFNRDLVDGTPVDAWALQVWPNMARLQQAIMRSRYQSFTLAVVLDALILGAVYMLVRYTRHARELADDQMKFVAATSHELRTPLTVIRGAAHNLQRGIVTEPGAVREYATMITQNTEQLSGMIEQVLAFATLRQTSHHLDRKPTDLRHVLRQAFAPLKGEMESSRVAFELNLPSIPAEALAEEKSLARAFQNLATNALKHGGAGGWVRAGLRRVSEGREAEITITDGGPGIPTEERERIFEPFYRGATATTNQTRGSGIGLSLVREIVRAHGGTVEAGNPERGAEFIVRLPLISTNP